MSSRLISLIPDHKIYVEPFCGGAALFFKRQTKQVSDKNGYREVLNDIDGDLVNMYRIAQTRKDEFLFKLSEFPYSEQIYREFKKNNGDDDLERAVGFYIRIMMSFCRQLDSGFAFSKYVKNDAISYFNRLDMLPEIIDRLKGVYLFNRDALDVIKKFDCEDAFFYCDPPYIKTYQGAYSGYKEEDLINLVNLLDSCKGKFLLSGYDNEIIPKHWERLEFKAYNSSSNTSKGGHRESRTECVWRKKK